MYKLVVYRTTNEDEALDVYCGHPRPLELQVVQHNKYFLSLLPYLYWQESCVRCLEVCLRLLY